jgi:thiamine-monophosphate kinase
LFRSEGEFVSWLRRRVTRPGRGLRLGIGDDAALVRVGAGQELILTSDLSIEGVHFRRELHPPRSVGHRALARSLSDIAAMGGRPRFALISLAISARVANSWVKAFYLGMLRLARRFGVAIIGGDTAVVPDRITVDVVVVGEVPRGQALRRSGARPGDQIFVSGRLGLSELGLRLLESGSVRRSAWVKAALQAHLWPQPQCALGRFLAARHLATAMMDISDGLSIDLARLCQASGVGARILETRLAQTLHFRSAKSPLFTHSRPQGTASAPAALDPFDLALHGGEDYQLLFTVRARKASAIPSHYRGVPLQRIGEIQKGKRLYLVSASGGEGPLPPAGYDHFQISNAAIMALPRQTRHALNRGLAAPRVVSGRSSKQKKTRQI